MKKLFIISLLSILYSVIAFAQTIPEPVPSLDKSENLFDHELQFKEWLARQPKETKGWKWMARYENDLLRRVDEEGKMHNSLTPGPTLVEAFAKHPHIKVAVKVATGFKPVIDTGKDVD